jgi:predicted RNA-binding Zn-ribbon protein involved in translation (DUF1610 family)
MRAESIHKNEQYPCETCGARCGPGVVHRALGTKEGGEADQIENKNFGYIVYYPMREGPSFAMPADKIQAAVIPMRLTCPECGKLHVDEGEFAIKPHHTHSCQHCGLTWRPAVEPTLGVRFLPGFKNGT